MSEIVEDNFDTEAVARHLTYHPRQRLSDFRSLSLPERSAVFNEFSPQVRLGLMDDLSLSEVVEILDHLDPLRAQQILARLPSDARRRRIIARLKNDLYEKVERFLQFHPRATISLLHLNYVCLPETTTVGDTAEIIERHLNETGKIPVVLVNQNGSLSGEVPLTVLVRERNSSKLRSHQRPIVSLPFDSDKEEIMATFNRHRRAKVAVVDTDGSVLGLVYSDDVRDLFNDQPATSLYNFAGVTASERPFDGALYKVKSRYRWLVINLLTCFLAAGVVGIFGGSIEEMVVLAMFMPIVTGMGGNAATQTLAVMVRGIAIGEISLANCRFAIVNEIYAGVINGLITSLFLIPIAWLLGVELWVALIGAVAVIFNMVVAGFFGGIIPLVLKRFGKDPATSAGILISTATDVLGYAFLLGLATWLLI